MNSERTTHNRMTMTTTTTTTTRARMMGPVTKARVNPGMRSRRALAGPAQAREQRGEGVTVKAEPVNLVNATSSSISLESLANNPTYVMGGIVALVVAAGVATLSRDQARGSAVQRVTRAAHRAEARWGEVRAEEVENKAHLEASLEGLEREKVAVDELRMRLEEAEARARELEVSIQEDRARAEELRVESASAWIDNWRANQSLQRATGGTLRVDSRE